MFVVATSAVDVFVSGLALLLTFVVLVLIISAPRIDAWLNSRRERKLNPDDPKTWGRYSWDAHSWLSTSPTEEDYLKSIYADRYGNPPGWPIKTIMKSSRYKVLTTIPVEPSLHKRYYDNTTLYKLPEYPALSASIHDKYCEHKMLSNVNYYEENPEKSLYYYG